MCVCVQPNQSYQHEDEQRSQLYHSTKLQSLGHHAGSPGETRDSELIREDEMLVFIPDWEVFLANEGVRLTGLHVSRRAAGMGAHVSLPNIN